ncbi:Activator of 90 kDa heat shock protein ATPase-like protein 2 [Bienertia sinuspersici]
MAKYGEGDKRWIVEDRPDGTNVHNWHWSETDCLEWSKSQLSNSLSDLTILSGEGNLFIKTKKIEKFEGEAYVNIRKGKIIPGYELNLVLSWEGEAKDEAGNSLLKSEGKVEVPYISDENADEDPEIRVTFEDEGVVGKRIKEAFLAKGKGVIFEKIRGYVESMARGGPCREELETKKVAGPKVAAGGTQKEAEAAAGAAATTTKKVVKKSSEEKKGFKTIKLSEKFRCRAVDLYEILMDENRWKGFTQSNAKISREVGGEFSIFNGSVNGTNVELQEGKLIVQKWRFGNWPEGVFSTLIAEVPGERDAVLLHFTSSPYTLNIVENYLAFIADILEIVFRGVQRGKLCSLNGEQGKTMRFLVSKVKLTFEEPESGITVVKLVQTDVPEEDSYGNETVVENTEKGWRDLIFQRIRAIFGFGL